MPRPSRLLLASSLLSFAAAPGCIHQHGNTAAASDHVRPVSELDITDPDPADRDDQAPPFCNPNGKQGEELRLCYVHNDAIYKGFEDEAKKREPWFNFAPDSWLQAKDLDPKFVFPVLKEDDAVSRLAKADAVELPAADAQRFTGKPLSFAGRKPYLVRALMYYKGTGNFSVFEKDQSVLVRHDSIGASNPGEKRTAVVLYLTFKPKVVYVDCQLTE